MSNPINPTEGTHAVPLTFTVTYMADPDAWEDEYGEGFTREQAITDMRQSVAEWLHHVVPEHLTDCFRGVLVKVES